MGNSDDTTTSATLVEYLATIPDPRSPRGRRYEWVFLLTLIAAAMMMGESTLVGISQWIVVHEPELVQWLQPKGGHVPSLATLRRALCGGCPLGAIEALEGAVGAYLQGRRLDMGESGEVVTLTGERVQGQAVDGKTVRCATVHTAAQGRATHLVAVVSHENGLVLSQANAPAKLDERKVAQRLLATLPLQGTVTTLDALHTSVKQADQLRRQGGHYLLVVKRNQKTLYQDIDDAFTVLPPQGTCECEFWQYEAYRQHRRGPGALWARTERYLLESTPALNHFLAFPDVAQVVRRTRWVRQHRTQTESVHVEYLVTSLPRRLVTLEQVAQLRRWHWTIENGTHYPRDVSFGEDRCQVHTGSAPEALAAGALWARNAVAGTLHAEGWPTLPNAFRFCRANPQTALRWIGAIAT